jgi:hypothetical protein
MNPGVQEGRMLFEECDDPSWPFVVELSKIFRRLVNAFPQGV